MKRYHIRVPFAGYFYATVEAENEKDAKEAALDAAGNSKISAFDNVEVGEWEVLKDLTRGNVLYAPLNSIEIDDVEDLDE